MHLLALAGPLAREQRHRDRAGEDMAGDLVAYHHRHIARRSVSAAVERGEAAFALDHIVEGGAVARGSVGAVAARPGIDDARIGG